MRVVRFHRYGGPEVLRIDETPRPVPGEGELLIEVSLAGVTLPVVRLTHGDGTGGGVPLPYAPGGEVVGRVRAVGPGVTGWRVGQRAAGLAFSGAYAEFVAVPAAMLAAVPDGVADAAALGLVRGGQVALGALRAGRLEPGESVLVTGAAGGVGHLAVQLARALGAGRVVAATGTPGKADFLRGLGVDELVDYGDPDGDWGDPVDVVLDGVGGDVQERGLRALRSLGRLVDYNGVGGPIDSNQLRMRGQSLVGFAMAHLVGQRPEVYERHRRELWQFAIDGAVRPAVHATLPLDGAAEAHRIVESRANLGKVVLDLTR
ncbi:zinc-binding dehydrogenase [Micromonospora sp. NPDC049559]|uniref:quinone oxidoreductase family protein n=1 Tax=Micromonospora sp. NPDC049559 TaxID=3155923 RepID=UPI00344593DF